MKSTQYSSSLKFGLLLMVSCFMAVVIAATAFSPSSQPYGYAAPLVLSNTDLTNGSKAYRPWFENGGWQGDLVEYDVSSGGALTTSIDFSGTSPAQGSPATNWSAHVQFAAAEAANAVYWDTGRKIITHHIGQVPFRWLNISADNRDGLDVTASGASAVSSSILDFLRGDRSNEGGSHRQRWTVLGDIIHSNPVYVATPNEIYVDSSYVTFVNNNINRDARIYVGANDGMLHCFDAETGDEVYAYVPSMLINDMDKLAATVFTHNYFVDGELQVKDAYYSSAWHTVLVGGLGAGGKGLFALDVTDPNLTSESISTGTNKKILWELEASSDDDLGYTFGRPVIAKLNDDKFYAIIGNGYSSVNGIAKLYIINIETGAVKKISTGVGSGASPNGLSSPSLVDTDNDGKIDYAYAGDLDGNLWKFDLTDDSSSDWEVSFSTKPLYDGDSTHPITTAPEISNHPVSGHLVYFTTGQLFATADITDTTVQSVYGLWDKDVALGSSPNLLTQTMSSNATYTSGSYTETVRTLSDNEIQWNPAAPASPHVGWVVDLMAGERALTHMQLRGGRLKATVANPDTLENFLIEFNYKTGGSAGGTIYDLNQDGLLDSADSIDSNTNGKLTDNVDVVMAWQRPSGIMSQITIARIENAIDTIFINYLNPPEISQTACSGICTGGFEGGHVDVDTDSPLTSGKGGDGYANKTDAHTHEYDDSTNRTYMDYFDLNSGQLGDVDTVNIGGSTEFIVIVANADLSPGSVLEIGDRRYPGPQYQKMIHQKLLAWDGVTDADLVDDDGKSLIFTIDGIKPTLRHSFDSLAIISGGLHPTQTGCVNKAASLTDDRWRNGSLITQLVSRDYFKTQAGLGVSPIDSLRVQNPPDLINPIIFGDGSQLPMSDASASYGGLTVLYQFTSVPQLDNKGNQKVDKKTGNLKWTYTVTQRPEFLYESTLFWHFSGACYGQPDWSKDKAQATIGITQAQFDAELAAAGLTAAELDAELAKLEACKEIEETDEDVAGGCAGRYELIENLIIKGEHISTGSGGGGSSEDGVIELDPVVMPGAASNEGITAGPNFDLKRRTWIDVTPQ